MNVRTEWADFFDGHAPEYNENCFTKNTIPEVDFLLEEFNLSPGASILDVGCGTGRHSVELARRGYAVTGLDVSTGMLEEAKEHAARVNVNVDWHLADATDFSFDKQFDAVICLCEGAFGLLGTRHDPIGQPLAILRNVAQAMKLNAKCLFTVLNGCALIRKYTHDDLERGVFDPRSLTERSDCIPGNIGISAPLRERAFVPTELILLFGLAGLEVLHIGGGTAGNWGKRQIDLDEIELMVIARKAADPLVLPGIPLVNRLW